MKVPSLHTERLRISHLSNVEPKSIAAYVTRNRESFAFTEPTQGSEYYSVEHWEKATKGALKELEPLTAMRFVLKFPDDTVVGMVNLSQIFRRYFQACYLGYSLDAEHWGRGLMAEALREIIAYSRHELRLHRLQANHMPENIRSEKLLKKLGFEREGFARSYLYLNGAWRDSILNALVLSNEEPWLG